MISKNGNGRFEGRYEQCGSHSGGRRECWILRSGGFVVIELLVIAIVVAIMAVSCIRLN